MSVLFEPFRVGNLEIKNRFMRSATYFALADEGGFILPAYTDLMTTLAENEVGLIVTGYAYVSRDGRAPVDMNGIDSDEHIPAYRKMTRAVHERGGRIVMQIAHTGAAAYGATVSKDNYLAVSLVDKMPDFGVEAREMEDEDVVRIIEAFGRAAVRVRESGFDGVQIHGAHGYLLSQFLSPRTNRRTDRWGGSLENRARVIVEIVRAIRKQAGEDYPVMIKIGVRDYLEAEDAPVWGAVMGRKDRPEDVEDFKLRPNLTVEEGAETARVLEQEGVCFVEISNGFVGRSSYKIHMGINKPEKEAYFLPEARVVREATTGPLALVAGMRSLEIMEGVINSGVADCISLCRPLIREPGLVKRWKDGDRRPADCISCGGCFNQDESGKTYIACRQLEKKGRAV